MFSGFVGHSFLSCAVSGHIFASPTASQILHAIQLCQPSRNSASNAGTLIVCGNYTGDILNAGLAVTRATAQGYKVRFVPVGDDVAVGRTQGGKVGRRGLSGHLAALKVVCALAEAGASLDRVADVLESIVARSGTIGVAFDRAALPTATLTELASLPPDTLELGMGAHGEPGLRRLSPVPSPRELVMQMLDLLTDTQDAERGFVPFAGASDEVVLLVNSLGSTSDETLAVFAELAIEELERRDITTLRLTLGPMVTSLKMSGFGFTVWLLPRDGKERNEVSCLGKEEALKAWDQVVDVVAWRQ